MLLSMYDAVNKLEGIAGTWRTSNLEMVRSV